MNGEVMTVEAAGETLVLLTQRAAYWPRRRTLLVADTHFGKAAAFRAGGIPVPHGTTAEGLTRLDTALRQTQARRIVFLGDFLHAKEGRAPETLLAVTAWRAAHADVAMLLVRGNHDRRAGDPPPEVDIACRDGPLRDPPFVFTHHPVPSGSGFVIAGHLHPGARLSGTGRVHARLACFVIGGNVAILPAFGDFTGLADIDPVTDARVIVIAGDQLVEATVPSDSPSSRRMP